MITRIVALSLALVVSSLAQAQCPRCGQFHPPYGRQAVQTSVVVNQWGSGRALQIAVAASQYRAARGIKGHCGIDARSGKSTGVGWSSYRSSPPTCYWERRNRGAYASVRGRDGWYSTLVLY